MRTATERRLVSGKSILAVSFDYIYSWHSWANYLKQHLYNGLKLGKDEIETVAIWKNEEGWDKALVQAKPWLLY